MAKKPALVYSEKYRMNLGAHVFPAEKYRLVFERMKSGEKLSGFDLLEPAPASAEEIVLAHTPEYLDSLIRLKRNEMTESSELSLTKPIVEAFMLMSGGTITAAREALARGAAANLGGGFHHAGPARAEGFCYLNDLAIAIRVLQKEKAVKRCAVVDCDLHQGNGTAKIFSGDESVFTFSIHHENNYPPKEKSSWDIGLADCTGDAEYLARLVEAVVKILDSFKPDLVLYQAGADPYVEDQLGQLLITMEGLKERYYLVLGGCRSRQIPAAVTLGGGYAADVTDTVQIHCNTLEAVAGALSGFCGRES